MVKSILRIGFRQWYENVSICNVAWYWIQCSSQLTPFLRLMTSDRSGATKETILIVSERILHWHIPRLTANVFCFRSDSHTTMNFITRFFTFKLTSQKHVCFHLYYPDTDEILNTQTKLFIFILSFTLQNNNNNNNTLKVLHWATIKYKYCNYKVVK